MVFNGSTRLTSNRTNFTLTSLTSVKKHDGVGLLVVFRDDFEMWMDRV